MNVRFVFETVIFVVILILWILAIVVCWDSGKVFVGRSAGNLFVDRATSPGFFWFLFLVMVLGGAGYVFYYITILQRYLRGELKDYWD